MVAEGGTGTVLASFGRSVLVDADPEPLHCQLKGRKLRIVCGDEVDWLPGAPGDAPLVHAVHPRRNLIERIDSHGRPESVAANIDRLVIAVAPLPEPDWFLVDRYWAGAVLKDVEALLVVNKADLGCIDLEAPLAEYAALGLPVVRTSCIEGQGMALLRQSLTGRVNLLVGQSGVGKSSLVNALVPNADAQTQALTRDAEGRHTTTTARRYSVDPATAIIDAPGVRDFAPAANLLRAAARAFVEIFARSQECRFKDCRHMQEPGCAVRTAVVNGQISARRYESYRRLFKLYQQLQSQS